MSFASNETIQPANNATKPTHFTISVELDGFSVTVEAEGKAENLRTIVDRLKAIGATPPAKANTMSAKPTGVPVCPIHHTPMKASRKPGSYFCPKRIDNGDYCPEKA